MQVCMQPAENAAMINRETIPVRIDITDRSFPEGIPALRWHERALARSPWIRRRFGHWVLLDPWDEELVDVAYGAPGIGQLEGKIAAFRERVPELRTVREPSRKPAVDDLSEPMPERFKTGPLWLPFMTAYELSFDHWLEVVDTIADRDKVAPGVRNAAIHALGEFVSYDEAPYDLKTCRDINCAVSAAALRPITENPATPSPDEWDIQQRAACALIRIASLPIPPEADDAVDQVREWWAAHRDDSAFRIEWSQDPSLRYAFLRPG
jgi:hypothetical protein